MKTKFSQELGVSFIHKYDIFMTPCVIDLIKYYIGCDLLCKELHCTGSVELLSYSQSELTKVNTHFDTVYKKYATHWHHQWSYCHTVSRNLLKSTLILTLFIRNMPHIGIT